LRGKTILEKKLEKGVKGRTDEKLGIMGEENDVAKIATMKNYIRPIFLFTH
jgi:2C-methyl-D-erythritol 2,4-cyclodiphosphate synthase